jgi:hypothetical protein
MVTVLDWFRGVAAPQRQFDPHGYFTTPMFDLVHVEPNFSGILTPEPERGSEKFGITDQFLQNASDYHTRYLNTAHYQRALSNTLAAVGFKSRPRLEILDIGTGSGVNNVVPCVRLFSRPRIVATDLSPNLLAILRDYLQHTQPDAEVACICTDAMNNFFKPACLILSSARLFCTTSSIQLWPFEQPAGHYAQEAWRFFLSRLKQGTSCFVQPSARSWR